MFTAFRFVMALAIVTGTASLAVAQATKPKPPTTAPSAAGFTYPADLTFTPGKEFKVDDPQTAMRTKDSTVTAETSPPNHFVIYIPKDYDGSRAFPVILNWHGMNSDPNTWPLKSQTDGKGFIIVGMEYLRPSCYQKDPNYDVGYVQRLLKWLGGNVKVDPKMIFFTGFSQGGWHVAGTCDKFADSLAGIVICSAGRGAKGPNVPAYRNMPVMLTAGETDGNRSSAETGAEYFKSQGAEVTLEVFPGVGHDIKVESPEMKQWWKDNGPARQAKVNFAAAEKAKAAGQLGPALAMYEGIAKNPSAGDFKAKAQSAADEISKDAQQMLDDAEALIAARKYPEARKGFAVVQTKYAGSSFADKAKERITYLDKDPTIATDAKQAAIDAKADTLEALAKTAEDKKDFAKALSLYENYLNAYPTAHRSAEVKKHLDELKADKTLVAAATTQAAAREGKANLEMANNYIKGGMPDKAKPFLQEIITKYPDTEWATKAKLMIDAINAEKKAATPAGG